MKVLVATEKPFAKAAVDGIKAEIEGAGNELVLLEKYTEKQQLLALDEVRQMPLWPQTGSVAVVGDTIVIRAGEGIDAND